ncbi:MULTISPECIES: hypothetical protein [unclassified Rhodococcus (in: high G+C Gram-positive bacteria)]|uniref:hypothetical protein n=1 Tax=unclassified Rhodococcus (in: high G+C Gram-positive bacteria) TaxID=192944 RepID=UPI000B9B397D|nr:MULTISPECIES: hypothetical protein [unclassified Rhodococcus (in: high G+C Gram-positive bacteria)]OZE36268.1 hypothetical protein CH259_13495 [Rhodococcus sp. 05-2254-4]OZE41343.1 hypothetical protein CH261_25120 [Rhodococcus sp. 05-2254-3]OZE44691.1 hypothetical protein CH283_27375 [Rhodococcus sp. 05-2254-2]
MRQVRTIVATGALIAVTALASTSCGSDEPVSDPPAPVTSAAAAPSANGYSDSDDGGGSGGIGQAPDIVTPVQAIPTAASAPAVPPAPNRDDVNVDARDFEQAGGQYFFQSPSGNVFCGFNSSNVPGTIVGCQVRYSVPGNTGRECLNTENNTYGVKINQDGTVEQICTNQGIFVGGPERPRVLEYGQVIGVTGTFCSSTEAGITCYDGDRGFMISRDVNLAF